LLVCGPWSSSCMWWDTLMPMRGQPMLSSCTRAAGGEHALALAQLQARHPHLSTNALPELLQQLLRTRQADGAPGAQVICAVQDVHGAQCTRRMVYCFIFDVFSGRVCALQGLRTLLGDGRLSLLCAAPALPPRAPSTAHSPELGQPHAGLLQRTCGAAAASTSATLSLIASSAIRPWLQTPHSQASAFHTHLLTQLYGRAAGVLGALRCPEHLSAPLRHAATFRGHRVVIYCLLHANNGRHVVTGSDDWLVKARFYLHCNLRPVWRASHFPCSVLRYCNIMSTMNCSSPGARMRKKGWSCHSILS
jgi:hypothetical protein